MKLKTILQWTLLGLTCMGCSSTKLITSKVNYQSVRVVNPKDPSKDQSAKIKCTYSINSEGSLQVFVYNMTDEIMVIDQTKSFFKNTNGLSTSYYDPTVRTTTTTNMNSGTTGASVNLGAIGGALGIGGNLGRALSGVNVGGSETNGQAVSNTTYFADQPKISLSPRGSGRMSKLFSIEGIGASAFAAASSPFIAENPSSSPIKFSVCITYSVDGEKNYEKIVTDFYASSRLSVPISNGWNVNKGITDLFTKKPDAIYEPWWILEVDNNILNADYSSFASGSMVDYQ